MALQVSGAANLGPTGGAVATGAISSSVYQDQSQYDETTTTTNTNSGSIGGSSYAAQIGVGGQATGNTITSTTTDFGAIAAASGIAQTAIASNAQGYSLLTSLTGRALDDAAAGIKAASAPLSQTIGKYFSIIFGLLTFGAVASVYFYFKRRDK